MTLYTVARVSDGGEVEFVETVCLQKLQYKQSKYFSLPSASMGISSQIMHVIV